MNKGRLRIVWIVLITVLALGAVSWAMMSGAHHQGNESANATLSNQPNASPKAADVTHSVSTQQDHQATVQYISSIESEFTNEHQAGNPLDVQCWMNNTDSTNGYISSNLLDVGSFVWVWFDPASCGANPYPYRVDSLRWAIYWPGAGAFTWRMHIVCPVVPGDTCSGPNGTPIWTSGNYTQTYSAAGGHYFNLPVSGICVSGPFFLGMEYVLWTGSPSARPSVFWKQATEPRCLQYLCTTTCTDWRDVWPSNNGRILARVHGNTSDACAPTACVVPQACDVTCPTGSIPEGEPNCQDQYVDNYNGGCNSNPPVFQTISCGQTICGTSGTFIYTDTTQHNYRDTDWYRLVVNSPVQLDWTGRAEFPLQLMVIQPINESCDTYTLLTIATGDSCDTVHAVVPCVNPGVYWLWAGPSVFSGIPCGRQYWATVTCSTCAIGRCCYGNDPSNPQCADNNYADCGALSGTWTPSATCAANPCPVHLACQAGPVESTQPPYNADENWTGVTSEAQPGYLAYENFTNLAQPVASIRFWGLDAYYSSGWSNCTEDPMPFVIKFYPDSSNYPSSLATCTYNVSLNRTATTITYGTFPLWQYDATLTPACSQATGWVSIQGQGDTTCWFLWASSPYGDGRSVQWAGSWVVHAYDQAMCLAGTPCDTSQHADSVSVSMAPGNANTRVRFRAPQDGTYLIYSTTDKNATYPTNFSVEPTGTLTVLSGWNIWVDPAAIASYKRYVVVHACP